ncbi:hypothetical protein G7Y79_00018g045030 [Physcia stellaris]|nr:hypothetical protein G7Y79_00018g045030 [Physcia stellaris]
MIYEHLRSIQPPTAKVGIACIYCDSQQQHTQSPQNLLASLWSFLHLSSDGTVPSYMENAYRVHTQQSTKPDLDQIQFIIQSKIDDLEKVYILIDGLDEYLDADQRETFIDSVKGLLDNSNTGQAKVSVLVTSRLEQQYLHGTSVQIRATPEEITSMIQKRIQGPRSFRHSLRPQVVESPQLQAEILTKIADKAKGMFLIADLHMKSLRSITNIRDLREALDRLPEKLDQYYEDAWSRISSQEQHLKQIAHNTISWLCLSRRQLKIDELRHALATRLGDKDFCAESLIAVGDILEICQGLVVVEQHSHIIRLMHSTTREFFFNRHNQFLKNSATYLVQTCLAYLCLDVFDGEPCHYRDLESVDMHANPGERVSRRSILSFRLEEYPLLDYAAENWGFHACDNPGASLLLIVAFLCSNHKLENAHLVHPQIFHPSNRRHVQNNDGILADLFPVRVAISFGLEQTACYMVERFWQFLQQQPIKDHWLKSLLEAVELGQLSVVDALLDAGVEPYPAGELPLTTLDRMFLYEAERPKTALDKSVFYGHDAIAGLLLQRGSRASITPRTIQFAVFADNLEILSFYLSEPKDQNKLVDADVILHLATKLGKLNIVQLSLNHGARIESVVAQEGCTALGLAVTHGHSEIVQYLLDAGADMSIELFDPSEESETTQSIVQRAATCQQVFLNRLELVNEYTLTYSSADMIDGALAHFRERLRGWLVKEPEPLKLLQDSDFLAALREDSESGKIISMLLDRGADLSVRQEDGESLLHLAIISKPRLNAVLEHLKRLPNPPISVSTRDYNGRTPLHYAAAACNVDSMELLIQFGADISERDNSGATTLHYAVNSSLCVKSAVRHGCRIDNAHDYLGTALQFAKSLQDLKEDVVEELERSIEGLTERGDPQPKSFHEDPVLPNPKSEEFESWMDAKSNESLLRSANIQNCLEGSQQHGYVEMIAEQDADAKKRTRSWILVEE